MGDTVPADTVARVNADKYWQPFKLAIQSGHPKLVETALDCVQKLVAHRCAQPSVASAA